jgi:pyruvate/2-oxoglutarate/acetoin dehydrogenase E1 component
MNQLINHLDVFEEMSREEYKPKVIIRTAVGATKPLEPGLQHGKDISYMLDVGLKNINVVRLTNKEDIVPEYLKALNSDTSTVLVEYRDLYECINILYNGTRTFYK